MTERRGVAVLARVVKNADLQTNAAGAFGYWTEAANRPTQMGHRWYDPTTGRFLSRDPAYSGRNWYVYCENSPLDSADPAGLDRLIVIGCLTNPDVLGGEWAAERFIGHRDGDQHYSGQNKGALVEALVAAGEDDEFWFYGHADSHGSLYLHREVNEEGETVSVTKLTQADVAEINRRRAALGKGKIKFAYLGGCYTTAEDVRVGNWLGLAKEIVGFPGPTNSSVPQWFTKPPKPKVGPKTGGGKAKR